MRDLRRPGTLGQKKREFAVKFAFISDFELDVDIGGKPRSLEKVSRVSRGNPDPVRSDFDTLLRRGREEGENLAVYSFSSSSRDDAIRRVSRDDRGRARARVKGEVLRRRFTFLTTTAGRARRYGGGDTIEPDFPSPSFLLYRTRSPAKEIAGREEGGGRGSDRRRSAFRAF